MKTLLIFFVAALGLLSEAGRTAGASAGSTPFDLTTELQATPLGIDFDQVRVSWKMPVRRDASGKVARGQRQTAYQIRVAASARALQGVPAELLWDSGRIESNASQLVTLPVKLDSFRRYFWTVRIWDENQRASVYAPATWFETGAIRPADWQLGAPCKWIQSPLIPVEDEKFRTWAKFATFPLPPQLGKSWTVMPEDLAKADQEYYKLFRDTAWSASLFRREFTLKNPLIRARLYISGLGYYRAFLNGQKLGARDLAPSDSHFSVKVNYQVFDLTAQLKSGTNCLGVTAVTGRLRAWLGHTPEQYHDRPVLLARLALEYADGTQEIVSTDESWQCGGGGIERQKFWCGELFDANTDPVGWKLPSFDARGWVAATAAKPKHPLGELRWDFMPPEKIVEQGHPLKRTNPMPGVWVYDFGKQLGGRVRL
ncbi:MAG: alpha-L-rhamnosidase N-terminal domain-containing protein, partial [Verrucomicrobia bacterium]|nr:alpha-L-rhamnosidase N-terminal domain-containing protein [Verrucomicrobiota bacterium]